MEFSGATAEVVGYIELTFENFAWEREHAAALLSAAGHLLYAALGELCVKSLLLKAVSSHSVAPGWNWQEVMLPPWHLFLPSQMRALLQNHLLLIVPITEMPNGH